MTLQSLSFGGATLWVHSFQFDTTPLVLDDCVELTIAMLLAWVFDGGARYFRRPMLNANSQIGYAAHQTRLGGSA